MDIPGYSSDQVKMTVEGTAIVCIHGERQNRLGVTYFFEKKFSLDEERYNLDSIDAAMEDGVLEIKILKKPQPQPRVIPISTKED